MKQESKELLLKDLCGRLPYGVKVERHSNQDCCNLEMIDIKDNEVYTSEYKQEYSNGYTDIENIRPYLFPLSNMKEEDLKSLFSAMYNDDNIEIEVTRTEGEDYYEIEVKGGHYVSYFDSDNLLNDINYVGYDWLNAHHYDYRGLIPMGLANDATGLNIYEK